jgi:hypothetical protein
LDVAFGKNVRIRTGFKEGIKNFKINILVLKAALNFKIICKYLESTDLNVGTKEKVGWSGRWQLLGILLGPW